jgi:hypothetical protein
MSSVMHVLVDDARSHILEVCSYELNRKLLIALMVAYPSGIMRKLSVVEVPVHLQAS